MLTILTIFTATSAANETTPPASIGDLRVINSGATYINWGWANPTDPDFDHTDIYINGVFKVSIPKGTSIYREISLAPYTVYKIDTHTVDTYGNVNQEWKNNEQRTSVGTIRFMTIGDLHLSDSTSSSSYKNIEKAVNYINSRSDVDFTVVMGDMSCIDTAKDILGKLNKPYRVVAGNHDIEHIAKFEDYFGFPAAHNENVNGYQLIFVGIKGTVNNPDWSFDYSTVDKSRPTIIFSHGPIQPEPGGTCSSWGDYYGYSCSMKTETDKFANLLGYYSGHVHEATKQKIGNILYVTEDNLGGYGKDSVYIGYTVINDSAVNYSTVHY